MKVIIPLAGKGTRLRPHTHSKPKPLVHVAGKPVLGHILDKISDLDIEEIIFITGDMEEQIKDFVESNYDYDCKYLKQTELLGDGHAINMASGDANEDILIIFVDTLFIRDIKADIEKIGDAEGIVWSSKTEDPRRFGILEVENGIIKGIEEKPENPKSDLAIIGLYYFKDAKKVFTYLNKVMELNLSSKGEYRLADAMSLMVSDGINLTTNAVEKWLDCGVPKTILETNEYLLKNGKNKTTKTTNSIIIEPVYIEDGATISDSVVGPNVSIAKDVEINGCVIKNSIVGVEAYLENINLQDSLIGDKAVLVETPKRLNVGDNTEISPKNGN
ncbi:hypothetical protein BVX95_02355 [archaeon D22]|nr:hypothetical protein BVX95_02355 [archaeon D22]